MGPPKETGDDTVALVDWYEEFRDSILPLEQVPAEARFPGALTRIKWHANGKLYKAKVVLISSDMNLILKAEKEVQARNAKLIKDAEQAAPGSRRSRKTASKDGTATALEVAKSLGERGKLPKEQETAKSKAKRMQKEKEAKQLRVEKLADMQLLNNKSNQESVIYHSHSDSDSDETDDDITTVLTDNAKERDDADLKDTAGENAALEETATNDSSSMVDVNRILDLKNPNTMYFLQTLLKIFTKNQSDASKTDLVKSSDSSCNYAEPVFAVGDAKVPLREGHNLLISKTLKTRLILKSKKTLGNSTRLLKRLLEDLYGKSQLKMMSTKGTRQFKGIPEKDLLAIYSFVNKHCQDKGIDWDKMVVEINKKCSRLRGGSPAPDSASKGSPRSKSKKPLSPDKTKQSPRKSPRKTPLSPDKTKQSPRKSPRKTPLLSFGMNAHRSPFKSTLKSPAKLTGSSPFKVDELLPTVSASNSTSVPPSWSVETYHHLSEQQQAHNEQGGGYQQQAGGYQQQAGGYQQQAGGYQQLAGTYQQQAGTYQQQAGTYQQQAGTYQQQASTYQQDVQPQYGSSYQHQAGYQPPPTYHQMQPYRVPPVEDNSNYARRLTFDNVQK